MAMLVFELDLTFESGKKTKYFHPDETQSGKFIFFWKNGSYFSRAPDQVSCKTLVSIQWICLLFRVCRGTILMQHSTGDKYVANCLQSRFFTTYPFYWRYWGNIVECWYCHFDKFLQQSEFVEFKSSSRKRLGVNERKNRIFASMTLHTHMF